MISKFRKRLSLYSWASYDFANTIYSAVVLTFYFPLYLTHLTGRNVSLGFSTTSAMVLAGLVVPWLGALSDRTGRTKAYLILATLLCIFSVLGITWAHSVWMLTGAFLLSCFFFHASLVFYCALLPVVAGPEEQGRTSGIGTALGYLGVLISVPIAHYVDYSFGRRYVFLVAGILFLLSSLPLFFWVPERKVQNPMAPSLELFVKEWKKVFRTVRALPARREFFYFFLGNFFVMDAVNTVIFWLVVYLSRVFNPSQTGLLTVFLGLNLGAFGFGFVAGWLTDRWGSRRTVILAAASLFMTILILSATGNFYVFAGVSLTGGAFSLAGIWTAARKRVVELSPAGEIGEYFGLYNLTTKISVVGSFVFSVLADQVGFRIALLSQAISSGLGLFFLLRSQYRFSEGQVSD